MKKEKLEQSIMTMPRKETTSIKLDVEVKTKAKEIFKGLPFEVKIPNDETKKAIEEARRSINMELTSIEEMMAEREKMKNA